MYLLTVYVLVIVLVFAAVLTLFLLAAIAAALFKALRKAAQFTLALWHSNPKESFSVSQHLNSKKVLPGGAA